MTQHDVNTLDLAQHPLKIADDVLFWPVRERGEMVYRIEIPSQHRFYHVGYEEYVLISAIDGTRTLPQACGLAAAQLGRRAPTSAQANTIARWLLRTRIAHLSDHPPPDRRSAPRFNQSHSVWPAWLKAMNPFWIKIPLTRVDRWINALAARLRWIFCTPMTAAMFGVILIASVALVTHWRSFSAESVTVLSPGNWVWLLVTWIALKLIHELAHAVACVRQGGSIHQSGIVFVLFAPMAFVDVSSCWRMDSRWSRIAVSGAGMFIEFFIAAIAFLLWCTLDSPSLQSAFHNIVLAAGLSTVVFNANVLMRFDGYYILADLIEVPNLYSEGMTSVRQTAKRVFLGEPMVPATIGGWRKFFVWGYGIAALLWRCVVCVTLAVAAATMFAGAGVIVSLLGIALWIAKPAHQLVAFLRNLFMRDPYRCVRAVALGTMTASMIAWLCVAAPLPTAVHLPGIVRYQPETVIRSRATGFVTEILAQDGQRVQRGQILVRLRNHDLETRRKQLQLRIAQNDIKMRQAKEQHDEGKYLVLAQHQSAAKEQLKQVQDQEQGLLITAPRNGRLVARGLNAIIGTLVKEGDSLAVVADDTDKEVVTLISQDRIDDVRPLQGESILIRLADWRPVGATLTRIDPSATEELVEPALATTEGGTLAVQIKDPTSSTLNLVQPHFVGHITLEPETAEHVPVGMRTTITAGYHRRSLIGRLQITLSKLWHVANKDITASE